MQVRSRDELRIDFLAGIVVNTRSVQCARICPEVCSRCRHGRIEVRRRVFAGAKHRSDLSHTAKRIRAFDIVIVVQSQIHRAGSGRGQEYRHVSRARWISAGYQVREDVVTNIDAGLSRRDD